MSPLEGWSATIAASWPVSASASSAARCAWSESVVRSVRGARVCYVAQSAAAAFNPSHRLGDQVIEASLRHRLMTREQAPKCLFDEAAAEAASIQPASTAQDASAARAERRERERDCFRDAERRVRAKLARLQAAMRRTIRVMDAHNANIH